MQGASQETGVAEAAFAALATPDRSHVERLVASWSMLADLCFSDLVLYLRVAGSPPDDPSFVMAGHVRPATSQTVYHSSITGEVRTNGQRPLVAESFLNGTITDGTVDSTWLGERLRVRCVPVRRSGRVLAVMAREWSSSIRRRPGDLEQRYLAVFGRFVAMIVDGTFPYATDPVEFLRYAPRVGDGAVVVGAQAEVEYASPNAVSVINRFGQLGNRLGHRLADLGIDDALVVESIQNGIPAAGEWERSESGRDLVVSVSCLPLLDPVRRSEASGAVVLLRDVSDLRRRDQLLVSKDATIREIHHRVKNNLQTISALLRLQGRRLAEPSAKAAIDEAVRRIRTIALVHETLSHEPSEDVTFLDVARPLARMVEEGLVSADRPLRVVITGDPGVLRAAAATPLAVVLTELLQNVVDHAYPSGALPDGASEVRVAFDHDPRHLSVKVTDWGVGIPASFDPTTSQSLGMSIVRNLVTSELGGEITFDAGYGGRGTVVSITVPRGSG